jgi:zinc/manganese transport system substrate-binding protein
LQDPHHVEAKPSLIARARNADLVVATGAELEIGWLPAVTLQAGNPKIQPGKPGYFEAAAFVPLLGEAGAPRPFGRRRPPGRQSAHPDRSAEHRPASPVRSRHACRARSPQRRVLPGALQGVRRPLERGDRDWEKQAAPLKGAPIIVQHKAFTYLEVWLGLNEVARSSPSRRRADDGASHRVLARCNGSR